MLNPEDSWVGRWQGLSQSKRLKNQLFFFQNPRAKTKKKNDYHQGELLRAFTRLKYMEKWETQRKIKEYISLVLIRPVYPSANK